MAAFSSTLCRTQISQRFNAPSWQVCWIIDEEEGAVRNEDAFLDHTFNRPATLQIMRTWRATLAHGSRTLATHGGGFPDWQREAQSEVCFLSKRRIARAFFGAKPS
jgi:hypothetical protein